MASCGASFSLQAQGLQPSSELVDAMIFHYSIVLKEFFKFYTPRHGWFFPQTVYCWGSILENYTTVDPKQFVFFKMGTLCK